MTSEGFHFSKSIFRGRKNKISQKNEGTISDNFNRLQKYKSKDINVIHDDIFHSLSEVTKRR